MIGVWGSYSNAYLYVVGVTMLAAFGLPLLVVPLTWARALRWEVSRSGNLTVTLGRSLGVFTSLIAVFAFRVTGIPAAQPFFFDLLLWLVAAMAALHVYGAITRTQPITETVEILVWVALFATTLCFYPR